MKRIEGWENIKENSGFEKLSPGGYIVKLLNIQDVPEKEYLKISFDIDEGEKKGFFTEQYKNNTQTDKKWPNAGSFIRSYKATAASMFRGFTNAVENSNKGYTFDFNEESLKGKKVGVIVAEEEYVNQKGQVRVRTYVSAVRSVDTIKKGEFTVPELKKLNITKTTNQPTNDFVNPFANDATTASEPVADNNPFGDNNPFA